MAIAVIVFVCLISGGFKYSLIGIGSESMTPEIDKGDAVFLRRVEDNKELKLNDVVAYKKGKLTIIHRIVRIEQDSAGNKVYRTKGDANNAIDVVPVEFEQVKGKVLFKIKYIAYPTVWLSELFGKR